MTVLFVAAWVSSNASGEDKMKVCHLVALVVRSAFHMNSVFLDLNVLISCDQRPFLWECCLFFRKEHESCGLLHVAAHWKDAFPRGSRKF